MNSPALKFETRQSQKLAPRLQYAVRLLQLSSLEYEQELREVMVRNPFLETAEPTSSSRTGAAPHESPGHAADDRDAAGDDLPTLAGSGLNLASSHDADFGTDSSVSFDATTEPIAQGPGASGMPEPERDSWLPSTAGARHGAGDFASSPLDSLTGEIGLRAHLRSQANLLRLSARDHALVCTVIESLDDDGYLRTPLADLATLAGLAPRADASEMRSALKWVQSLEPTGVGAQSVPDCLLLQLAVRARNAVHDTARAIVAGHLERLAQRDVVGLARTLQRPLEEVDAACLAIRTLDPHPGWRFGRGSVHYVTPDVVVRKVQGRWQAQLNPQVVPRVRLNEGYAALFARHRDARHGEMAGHLQEARWAVRNVEQRYTTILSVAQSILRHQYRFFEHGAFAMKPLGLRDVSEEVGLHESTVCRVTNNKFMATPAGVFELKHFFSRAMPMASGGACSATAIRGVLRELIDSEDPAHPLSDVQIAQRLARQGVTVARRTVTKYRQMMKIHAVDQRRAVVGSAQRSVRSATTSPSESLLR